jgi:hypothetical protein
LTDGQINQLERAFSGFISRNNGRDLKSFGKSVIGSETSDNKNMVRAVTQFVGAAASDAGGQIRQNWAEIPVVRVELPGQIRSLESIPPWNRPAAFMAREDNSMAFTGWYDGRNLFGSPSNIARLMIHETMHRRDDWTTSPLLGPFAHQWLDQDAKSFLQQQGLAGEGCWAWKGFGGC